MNNNNEPLKNKQLIYVDTCTLMNTDSFMQFVESNKDYLHLNEQKIIILGAIHYELNNLLKSEYEDRRMQAKKALDYIYANKYLFDIRKRKEFECFGDHQFQLEILQNRRYKTQVLITEDHNLAKDIFKFNDIQSSEGKQISVLSINKEGHLYFPEYLDTDTNAKTENLKVFKSSDSQESTNTNYVEKAVVTFVGGILSGLAAPFIYKKIKSCFN